ncbi:type II toxin-antitoxin system RelE/ParE family toxin [Chitinimonas arctica]|uniref:Type II toxin-antitoxin system RelE/ParE family toxin n=1 Tax=Chitinimonas arctica TaxID=2594795 RepID=A0A516SKI9_9NEIS|nr:type II toxin-antitoxin system RelE/ParE family toxin [Chitinimonas arctica]QDQ28670.1 type II toxin-antitoxin system RelE/ParE family toxin [Chitinimonas arctica]
MCYHDNSEVTIEEYLREDGTNPYKRWFDALDAHAAAKVAAAKVRLVLGNTSSVKWFDGIGEYIIDWGPGYRIYLAKDGDTLIIFFGGGTKQRQQRDIDQAKALHAEYKARKKARQVAKQGKRKGN